MAVCINSLELDVDGSEFACAPNAEDVLTTVAAVTFVVGTDSVDGTMLLATFASVIVLMIGSDGTNGTALGFVIFNESEIFPVTTSTSVGCVTASSLPAPIGATDVSLPGVLKSVFAS